MNKIFLMVLLVAMATTVWAKGSDGPKPLTFTHRPFVKNGVTYVPLKEATNALGAKMLQLNPKSYIVLPDGIHGGKVTFVPAKMIAKKLASDISITNKTLTIGTTSWSVTGKFILVDRGRQQVFAFEGLKQVRTFRTCTGKPGFTTPTGIFRIYKKIKGKHLVVGMPWGGIMYNPVYYHNGAALHGSTEMRLKPSSHGCCRLYYSDADWLYDWTPIGTTVYIIP